MAEMTISATLDNLDDVLSFVDAQLEAWDCPMKAQVQIDVAVEEIFVNIAHYAYAPETGDAHISIALDEAAREVAIQFRDGGVPFNPLDRPDPDTSLSAEERSIGGLGIFMAKKSMDSMAYDRRDGQNILTLKKAL